MWTRSCVSSSSRWSERRTGLGLAALWVLASCYPAPEVLAQGYPLEVIEVRSRLPQELIPLLRPLAGPDGTLIAAPDALLVRASPERLAGIRQALTELDRPARSLLIQVRQGSDLEVSGAATGARIDASRGRGGGVRIGPREPRGTQVIASAGQGQAARDLTQEVRVLDGHPAFIATGLEQPFIDQGLEPGPGGAWRRQGWGYRRSEGGFTVIPRVLGERVILDIETRAAWAAAPGAVETRVVGSRVEGPLGEWIPIGSSGARDETRSAGPLYGVQGRREIWDEVHLRVLPLD